MTYTVEIKECNVELSAKDRIKLKDTTNAIKLDEATTNAEQIVISPEVWATLSVYNEKADDKEYEQFIIIDKNGVKYVTGSHSFWNSFMAIADELNGEEFDIIAYRVNSKNYAGKQFITCSLA